jgi:hypothetical protein
LEFKSNENLYKKQPAEVEANSTGSEFSNKLQKIVNKYKEKMNAVKKNKKVNN